MQLNPAEISELITHSGKNGYYGEGKDLSTSTPGVYAEKEEVEEVIG